MYVAAETRALAEKGGELLISTLALLSADYVQADEELALQFVRALAVLSCSIVEPLGRCPLRDCFLLLLHDFVVTRVVKASDLHPLLI